MDAIALRRFRIGETTYEKGEELILPDGQFNDLWAVGLVEAAQAPAEQEPVNRWSIFGGSEGAAS